MERRELKKRDVVQISPTNKANAAFGGCMMIVTEPKPWGAQGFVAVPRQRGEPPASAYFRATWEDMEYIGTAIWAPEDT